MVNGANCTCRRPRLRSQHQNGDSQPSGILGSEAPTPSSGLHRYYMNVYTHRQSTRSHKIKVNISFKNKLKDCEQQ